MDDSESATLEEALQRIEIELPAEQIQRLDRYCELAWSWNQKLNLTRHTNYDLFASRDVWDTLQLSEMLKAGEEVLDVGTGGGVPGVLLAILRPDLEISLCESVAKKAQVVDSISRELELPTPFYQGRAEDVLEDMRFDVLVMRAVGPLWKICKWFQPHWHSFDRLLAIKGPRWVEERNEARHRGFLQNVELRCSTRYPMLGTESESVILELWAAGRNAP